MQQLLKCRPYHFSVSFGNEKQMKSNGRVAGISWKFYIKECIPLPLESLYCCELKFQKSLLMPLHPRCKFHPSSLCLPHIFYIQNSSHPELYEQIMIKYESHQIKILSSFSFLLILFLLKKSLIHSNLMQVKRDPASLSRVPSEQP